MAAYDINYEDDRFKQVEVDKKAALSDVENTYGSMISESDKYYQAQIDASKEWTDKQQQIQQDNTDFALEQIEQQKDQANKDYLKEQSGAYADWQKQSNQYGANAEQMAANGLSNTGYSESSQVSMYNTYQNRVAVARDSYNRAVLNYDNAMKDAILQNNAALAQIAYEALQQQLELSLQGFQYKNQLLLEQQSMKQQTEDRYYSRYQDVLNQINTENSLAEQVRQYNESMKLQREQMAYQKEQDNRNYQLQLQQLAEEKRQFDAKQSASGGLMTNDEINKGYSGNVTNSAYWNGAYNKDCKKFGTFSNGYQPKGISGHGTISKSGASYTFDTKTLYGQKQTVTQNVWTAEDNTYWYWDGAQNKYIQLYYNDKSGEFATKNSGSSSTKNKVGAVGIRL